MTSDEIVLSPVSDSVEIGDEISLTGTIDPALLGSSPAQMILLVHSPYGSQENFVQYITPDADGTIRRNITADKAGEWEFTGKYAGKQGKSVQVRVVPRVTQKPSVLSITSTSGLVQPGQDVTVTGWLRDKQGAGIAYVPVSYEVAFPIYGCSGKCREETNLLIWNTLGSTTTDKVGQFSFVVPVSDSGVYSVRAHFYGSAVFAASDSKIRDIRVS